MYDNNAHCLERVDGGRGGVERAGERDGTLRGPDTSDGAARNRTATRSGPPQV